MTTRRLLVDDEFIADSRNLVRTLHRLELHQGNPLLVQDKPWECHKEEFWYPSVCMWSCPVLIDSVTGLFKMWYLGYSDRDEQQRPTALLMYAESRDGVHWNKPDLGVYDWKGSKAHNIVLAGITDNKGGMRLLDSPNIMLNPKPAGPHERYLLLAHHFTNAGTEGVWLYRSADGLRWDMVKPDAIPNAREFNSFFWDQRRGKFIGAVRLRNPVTPRHVGYTESADGVNWTPAELMLAPKDLNTEHNLPGDDVYGLIAFPYESHYLGFLHTHHADRRIEVQLMASVDARHWHFVAGGSYILPNDPRGGPGQGMMSTQNGPPLRVGDNLWVYVGISPCAHRNPGIQAAPGQQKRTIGLALMRLDGFVSLDAGPEGGTLTTKPMTLAGKALYINAKAEAGEIRAELLDALDEAGSALSGYALADCAPVREDGVKLALHWKKEGLPEGKVRIRFHIKSAGLYSFWSE